MGFQLVDGDSEAAEPDDYFFGLERPPGSCFSFFYKSGYGSLLTVLGRPSVNHK